ncbi:MAG: hypothetical protein H0T48_11350 [Gemmatimonadaceae bacterium]|nr:hypothetical protein [Gemmatimonadaceae bacterium]
MQSAAARAVIKKGKGFDQPFIGAPTCDGDGIIDWPADPGCRNADDDNETGGGGGLKPKPQCSDGIDNDSDGLTDWRDDPQCKNKSDNDEGN